MKARIRDGAVVGQDFGFGPWHSGDVAFDCEPLGEGRRYQCRAPGYGKLPDEYGAGAVYVKTEDLIPVEEVSGMDKPEETERLELTAIINRLESEKQELRGHYTSAQAEVERLRQANADLRAQNEQLEIMAQSHFEAATDLRASMEGKVLVPRELLENILAFIVEEAVLQAHADGACACWYCRKVGRLRALLEDE